MTKTIKRFLMVFAVLFSVFALASCGGNEQQEALDAAVNELSVSAEANADFDLPTAVGDVTIAWTSNNAAISVANGKATVTIPAYGQSDASVTLTATLTIGELTQTKNFTVTVKASTVNPQIAKDQAAQAVADALALPAGVVADNLTGTFALPSTATSNPDAAITWTSELTNVVITGNNAVVTAPAFETGDVTGKIIATVSLNGGTGTKEFTVKVLKAHAANVLNAYNGLSIQASVEATNLGIEKIKTTFDLPIRVSGVSGIRITWSSSNTEVISVSDKELDLGNQLATVTRPVKGQADAEVTLTATITATVSGETDTVTKEFKVKVLAIPASLACDSIAAIKAIDLEDENVDNAAVDVAFSGTVMYILNNSFNVIDGIYVSDGTNAIYCYGDPGVSGLKVGDKVTVDGTYKLYYSQPEIDRGYALTITEAAEGFDFSAAGSKTIDEIIAFSATDKTNYGEFYKVIGQVVVDGSNYYLESAAGLRINLYYKSTFVADPEDATKGEANYRQFAGKWVEAVVVVHDYHSSNQYWRVVSVPGQIQETDAPELTNAQKVEYAKNLLATNYPQNLNVFGRITLDTEYTAFSGLTITWASADETVIKSDGTVVSFAEDKTVKLTATLTAGEETGTYEVDVTVKALEVSNVDDVIAAIDAGSDEVFLLEVVVLQNINTRYNNLFVGDETGVLYVYGSSGYDNIKAGDKVQLVTGTLQVYEGSNTNPGYTRQTANATVIKLADDATVTTPSSVAVSPKELAIASFDAFKAAEFVNGYQYLLITGTVSVGKKATSETDSTLVDDDSNVRIIVTEGQGENTVTYSVLVNSRSSNLKALKAFDGQIVNFLCVAYGASQVGEETLMTVYGLGRDGDVEKWIQQPNTSFTVGQYNRDFWGSDYVNSVILYSKAFTGNKTPLYSDRVAFSWDEEVGEYVIKEILVNGVASTSTLTTYDYLLVCSSSHSNFSGINLSGTVKVGDIVRINIGDAKTCFEWLEGKDGASFNWSFLIYPEGAAVDAATAPTLPTGIPYSVNLTENQTPAGFVFTGTGTYSDKAIRFDTTGDSMLTNELFNTEKLTVKFTYKINPSSGNASGKVIITALDASKNPIEGGSVTLDVTATANTEVSVNLAVMDIKYVMFAYEKTAGNLALYDLALSVYHTQEELDTASVNAAKSAVTVSASASENFKLPVSNEANGVAITWASDNAAIAIDAEGNATVTLGNEEVIVKLTATFTKGEVTSTADYNVTLPKGDALVINEALLNSIIEEGQTIKYYKYTTANVTDSSATFATQDSCAGFGGMVMIIENKVYFLGKGSLIELDSEKLGKTDLTRAELRPYGFYGSTETDYQGLMLVNGAVEPGNQRGYGALYYNSGTADLTFTVQFTYGRNVNMVGAHRLLLTLNPETGLYTPTQVNYADVITLKPGEYLFAPSTFERFSTGLVTSSYTEAADGTAIVAGALQSGVNNVKITTIEDMYEAKFAQATSVIKTNGGSVNKSIAQYKVEFLTDFYNWCVSKGAFTAEAVSLEAFIGTTDADKKSTGTWINYTGTAGNPSTLFTNYGEVVNFLIAPSPETPSHRINTVIDNSTYFLNDATYNAKWGPLMVHIETMFRADRVWSAGTNYGIYELGRWMQEFNGANTYVTTEQLLDIPAEWKVPALPESVELTSSQTYTLPTIMYNGDYVFGGWVNDKNEAITEIHFGENATAVWKDSEGNVISFPELS